MKRKMGKRYNIVITAVVEKDARNWGKLFGDVAWQLEIVDIPLILIP